VTGRDNESEQAIEVLSLPGNCLARGTLPLCTLPDACDKTTTAAKVRSDDVTGADRNFQPIQGDICG
jgi:hypothetical protein